MATRRASVSGLPKSEPWRPPDWEIADAAALQAIAHGRATDVQQRRGYEFLVKTLCGTYDLAYRPGGLEGERDTTFAEGRRFVGLQLVKFANLNIAAFLDKPTEQGSAPEVPQENR